jgi:pyruvate dehydrogenase E2 component (dihydrolipoamide acetyltransferase)
MRDFKLPDLGEGVHEGKIMRVLVAAGDVVREDQPLLEVETDKAAVEIPSPFAGRVSAVHVKAGQLVHVGDAMVSFDAAAAPAAAAPAQRVAAAPAARTAAASGPATATIARPPGRVTPASPAVRRRARELGLDLAAVPGSGPGGRVTRQDIERAATSAATATTGPRRADAPAARRPSAPAAPPRPPAPEPPGTDGRDQHGAIRRQPLTQARKTIAGVMAGSWSTIPHVTDCHDVDVTELDRLRRGYRSDERPQRRLTMLAFVVRAVARGLLRCPVFNASFDVQAEEIIYRRYVNIAIGVHTERGLIAPVLRDADGMGVPRIADELEALAEKARRASFAVSDIRGGTYTISNPGALGRSRYSTPIITPPQVAVLAVGRATWQPWVVEGQVVPRLILPLSHSFDHRVIDGGDELAFMSGLSEDLENPARLLLEG